MHTCFAVVISQDEASDVHTGLSLFWWQPMELKHAFFDMAIGHRAAKKMQAPMDPTFPLLYKLLLFSHCAAYPLKVFLYRQVTNLFTY